MPFLYWEPRRKSSFYDFNFIKNSVQIKNMSHTCREKADRCDKCLLCAVRWIKVL